MIIGDSGSVMERLIKAGKFVYDEENMCLNKVTSINTKINKKKENTENEGDSKFKTISSMNTVNNRKFKKIGSEQYNQGNTKNKSNQKTQIKYENEKRQR